jgi:nucleotide-binding universal stress UspA family protein
VGVASGEDIDAAVEYAAAQALERSCGVHLVTVVNVLYLGPPELEGLAMVRGDLRAASAEVLARAAAAVRRCWGDVDLPVTTEALRGPVVPTLVEAATGAELVVLQRQQAAPLPRVRVMSVANGVAAHAAVPVVVVPWDWHPTRDTDPVVVGVDDLEDAAASRELLRTGIGLAVRERRPVEVVHAWWYSDAYDPIVFAGEAGVREAQDRCDRLTALLAPVVSEHPDLVIRPVVQHGRPADVLVHSTAAAAAVVVGRHHPSVPFGSHLGPVTRTVLREAVGPVIVVGASRSPKSAQGAER